MNKPFIEEMIKNIEAAEPERVVMSRVLDTQQSLGHDWTIKCGTAACIAGWAMVTQHKLDGTEFSGDFVEIASALMGLHTIDTHHNGARALFLMGNTDWINFTNNYDGTLSHELMAVFDLLPALTRKELMLGTLRKLLKTGKVNWQPASDACKKAYLEGTLDV